MLPPLRVVVLVVEVERVEDHGRPLDLAAGAGPARSSRCRRNATWVALAMQVDRLAAGREGAEAALVVVQGQADLLQVVGALARRAASRAACTAGSSSAISTAMIAITTSNSIRVKPAGRRRRFAWDPHDIFSIGKRPTQGVRPGAIRPLTTDPSSPDHQSATRPGANPATRPHACQGDRIENGHDRFSLVRNHTILDRFGQHYLRRIAVDSSVGSSTARSDGTIAARPSDVKADRGDASPGVRRRRRWQRSVDARTPGPAGAPGVRVTLEAGPEGRGFADGISKAAGRQRREIRGYYT